MFCIIIVRSLLTPIFESIPIFNCDKISVPTHPPHPFRITNSKPFHLQSLHYHPPNTGSNFYWQLQIFGHPFEINWTPLEKSELPSSNFYIPFVAIYMYVCMIRLIIQYLKSLISKFHPNQVTTN